MFSPQKQTLTLIYRTLTQDPNKLSAKKISTNCPHTLKTEVLQEYQSLNFHKKENHSKRPIFQKPHQELKKKHCIIKPTKTKFNDFFLKLTKDSAQNFTTEEKSQKNPLYPNLAIKRSGSTAPSRKRLHSQHNKQNHMNQQEKPQIECTNKQKNLIKESVSSIYHYHNEAQQKTPNKISNHLVRLKSKPHLVFCSSKLPKDFFGESVLGENLQQGQQYKFIVGNGRNSQREDEMHGIKRIKCSPSVKLMKCLKNNEKLVEKLNFVDNNDIVMKKQVSAEEKQSQFTFRKQKSKKCIEVAEQSQKSIQTPKFQHKRQTTTPSTQNLTLPNLVKKIQAHNSVEPKRKMHRNYSRQLLKL